MVRGVMMLAAALLVQAATGCTNGSGATAPSSSSYASEFGLCRSVDTSVGDALANVCERGQLRFVVDRRDAAQLRYDPTSQQWTGFGAEVANEVAARLGVSAEITPGDRGAVHAGSWSDRWDATLGSLTETAPSDALFAFTPAYLYLPVGVAVNAANTSIQDVESDLDGADICVGESTSADSYLQGTLVLGKQEPPLAFVIDYPQITTDRSGAEALDHLAQGDGACDAVVAPVPEIEQAVSEGKAIKMIGVPLYAEPLSIAFDGADPVDNATLATAVGNIVNDMHADGTLSSLSMRWYGSDWTAPSVDEPSPSPS